MDLLTHLLPSRLWVKATGNCISGKGRNDWCFYYCIEGCSDEVKNWMTLFVNRHLEMCYLRSPFMDIKLKNVMICESKFMYNVYRLIAEPTSSSRDHNIRDPSASHTSTTSTQKPLLTPSACQLYPCAGPLYSCENLPESIPITEHMSLVNRLTFHTGTVAGYTAYNARGKDWGHKKHYTKTWIPLVRVDPATLNFRFRIDTGTKREKSECFECMLKKFNVKGVQNPALSNFIINH